MKNILYTILTLLIFTQITFAQHKITVHLSNYNNNNLFWAEVYGDDITTTDTLISDNKKDFSLILPEGQPSGLYRIIIKNKDKDNFITVIFEDNDIELETDALYPIQKLQITKGNSTIRYHKYMKIKSAISYKKELLSTLLEKYPKSDTFYNEIEQKISSLTKEINNATYEIIDEAPESFVSKILYFELEPEANSSLSSLEKNIFLKKHYFDEINFLDPSILRSHAIPTKIINYLSLYRNPSLYKANQEGLFMQAIDTILLKTKINPEIYDYTANYLIEGFKRYGFENLVTYIALNTDLEINCSNDEKKAEFTKKIENIKSIAIGQKAPNIILPDLNGEMQNINNINSEYTLIIFWASWCPHCTEMLPKLQKLYNKNKNKLTIVAISLDTEKDEWEETAKQYPWIHLSELRGWDGYFSEKYVVYATPTMFLLNSDKEIIAKPDGIKDLKKDIKN